MERLEPVRPDDRPCNNGCPLYGEVAMFGPDLAGQINTELERQLHENKLPDAQNLTESQQCASLRIAKMCIHALSVRIVRVDALRPYGVGQRMQDAPIPKDNPYL